MCGIAGMVGAGVSADTLQQMSATLRHRGPDDEGFVCWENIGDARYFRGDDTIVELGLLPHLSQVSRSMPQIRGAFLHRRLSIIDLSVTGHQPQTRTSGLTIVYNGEVYNYLELREELRAAGISFETDSDTEVILAAYEHWGAECVNRFVGMWAFAILDPEKRQLVLIRDRYGVKPLYFHAGQDFFAFASEAKALLHCDGIDSSVNESALYQYLSFGRISRAGETLFGDIQELPAGCMLTLPLDSLQPSISQYYDLETAFLSLNDRSQSDLLELYSEALVEAVKIHLRADVPVGSCLSGGLDSSALVSIASSMVGKSEFRTFTAAYTDPAIDEAHYARLVVESCGNVVGYKTYPTAEGFWESFRDLITIQDFPIGSTSIFAQREVMRLASEKSIKVLLDGQGADESLGGYSLSAGVYLLDQLRSLDLLSVPRSWKLLKQNRSIDPGRELLRAVSLRLPGGQRKLLRSMLRSGARALHPDFRNAHKDELPPIVQSASFKQNSIAQLQTGLSELLRYEDRNSMAFSIESRVPFLDHRLVEISLALPTSIKMFEGWSKYPLRNAVSDVLPKDITWRKDKKGFVTPQKKWLQDLRPKMDEFIKTAKSNPYFDHQEISRMIDDSCDGKVSDNGIWRAVSGLMWMDVFVK